VLGKSLNSGLCLFEKHSHHHSKEIPSVFYGTFFLIQILKNDKIQTMAQQKVIALLNNMFYYLQKTCILIKFSTQKDDTRKMLWLLNEKLHKNQDKNC
jgi:hypothetical protein